MKDVKIILSILWIAHFLIWSFGDIIRLLSDGYLEKNSMTNDALLFVAPFGAIQAIMIVVSVTLEDKPNRLSNLIIGIIYTLINVGYLVDNIINQYPAWEILLTSIYLIFNVLIIRYAFKWPIVNDNNNSTP